MSATTMMEVLTEIQRITQSSNPYKTAVTAGLAGGIKVGSGLRSLYWRIYLGLLSVPRSKPRDSSDLLESWEEEVHALRKQFALGQSQSHKASRSGDGGVTAAAVPAKKKSRFGGSDSDTDDDASSAPTASKGVTSSSASVIKDNPLSSDKDSSYAKAFQRKKLEEIIDKDLGRLWSDDPFFESDLVRDTLRSILIEFCEEDREDRPEGHIAGYRQGMHEVLSLIMYVVHRDAELVHSLKPKLNDFNAGQESDWSIIQALFAPAAVAQDSMMIFSKLMVQRHGVGLASWYHSSPNTAGSPTAASPTSPNGASMSLNNGGGNVVVDVANDVQVVLLKSADETLWKVMNKVHDIQPTSYLLRWLRLLFLREFPFHQVMQLWDSVLAEYSWRVSEEDEADTYTLGDSIVPHLALSMLLYIEEDLQSEDFSIALRRLMRYPPVEDVRPIVRKAIERRHRGSRLALIAGLLSSGNAAAAGCLAPMAAPTGGANSATTGAAAVYADPLSQEVAAASLLLPQPTASSVAPPAGLSKASTFAPPPSLVASSVSRPPPLAASFGGTAVGVASGSTSAAARAVFAAETTTTLRDKQIRQGMALASIVRRMETRWFPPKDQSDADRAAAEEDYLVAIAELKRVRDVLLGSLTE